MKTKNNYLTMLSTLAILGSAAQAVAATYTVTNRYASGNGTLLKAITDANTNPGPDIIEFNIPTDGGILSGSLGPDGEIVIDTFNGSGPETAYTITEEVMIDATTQPGYDGVPLITCRGLIRVPGPMIGLTPIGDGALTGDVVETLFHIEGTDSTSTMIKGLQLTAFSENAVLIDDGADGCRVEDSFVGFSMYDGEYILNFDVPEVPAEVTPSGILVRTAMNRIRRNTVSGVYNAIAVGGGAGGGTYADNQIGGNYIGTTPDGESFESSFGNLSDGVVFGRGAQMSFVGPGNLISGHGSTGVELGHSSNVGVVCFSNKIGTNDAGTATVPNGQLGCLITNGANFCAVGGPFGGNLISGNELGGVSLGGGGGSPVTTIYVQNNFIGCNAALNAALGGQQTGIGVENSAGNAIEGNIIVGHTGNGVFLSNSPQNLIAGNGLGLSVGGIPIANGGYGVLFLNGSNFNYVGGFFAPKPFNYIGANTFGPFGQINSGGNGF